jgi:hypothetical protein
MPHGYTEDQLVEQPAIGLFAELARLSILGGSFDYFPGTGLRICQ